MNKKILNHYSQFSQYTDPGLYKKMFKNLPAKLGDVGPLLRQQFIHAYVLSYSKPDMTKGPSYRQCEDDNFPTVSAILAELYRRDKSGFTPHRLPENKLVLTCRTIAILMASILKSRGVQARVRAGFASFFPFNRFQGRSATHFLNQYWSRKEKRWVTIDTDIRWQPSFDLYDMPKEVFDYPADVWLNVRTGKVSSKHFCHSLIADFPALPLIALVLLQDFYCLMNREIIYLHMPKKFNIDNFKNLNERDLKELDKLSRLMRDPDGNFDKLKKLWETKRDFRHLTGAMLSYDWSSR